MQPYNKTEVPHSSCTCHPPYFSPYLWPRKLGEPHTREWQQTAPVTETRKTSSFHIESLLSRDTSPDESLRSINAPDRTPEDSRAAAFNPFLFRHHAQRGFNFSASSPSYITPVRSSFYDVHKDDTPTDPESGGT